MGLDTGLVIIIDRKLFDSNKSLKRAFRKVTYVYSWLEETDGHQGYVYHFGLNCWRNCYGIATEINNIIHNEYRPDLKNEFYFSTDLNLEALTKIANRLKEIINEKWWSEYESWSSFSFKEVEKYEKFRLKRLLKIVKRLHSLDDSLLKELTIHYYNS